MPLCYDTNMINCEQCNIWYHFKCVKVDHETVPDVWLCCNCKYRVCEVVTRSLPTQRRRMIAELKHIWPFMHGLADSRMKYDPMTARQCCPFSRRLQNKICKCMSYLIYYKKKGILVHKLKQNWLKIRDLLLCMDSVYELGIHKSLAIEPHIYCDLTFTILYNYYYSSGSHTFKGTASRLSAVPTRLPRNMSIPQEVASLPGKYEYSAGRARCTAASSYAYSMPQCWKNLTKFATHVQPTRAVPEL